MRVAISSNLGFGGVRATELDVSGDATLRDLLTEVAMRYEYRLLAPDLTKVVDEVQITVNGKDYLFLPRRLETSLNEGDEIGIYFYPLGGG
ncbi:MAG TPA: MoaD/ThiS family protein [Thermoleophilia bacterium]|nr:MoaD/ThiS family protein [Thermoleophilia bacterium]